MAAAAPFNHHHSEGRELLHLHLVVRVTLQSARFTSFKCKIFFILSSPSFLISALSPPTTLSSPSSQRNNVCLTYSRKACQDDFHTTSLSVALIHEHPVKSAHLTLAGMTFQLNTRSCSRSSAFTEPILPCTTLLAYCP